jgi:hypothetical protein
LFFFKFLFSKENVINGGLQSLTEGKIIKWNDLKLVLKLRLSMTQHSPGRKQLLNIVIVKFCSKIFKAVQTNTREIVKILIISRRGIILCKQSANFAVEMKTELVSKHFQFVFIEKRHIVTIQYFNIWQ